MSGFHRDGNDGWRVECHVYYSYDSVVLEGHTQALEGPIKNLKKELDPASQVFRRKLLLQRCLHAGQHYHCPRERLRRD